MMAERRMLQAGDAASGLVGADPDAAIHQAFNVPAGEWPDVEANARAADPMRLPSDTEILAAVAHLPR